MKIKRITSMLLALVMCVSLFANWPVPAFATEETPAEQVIVETTPAPVGDGVLDIPAEEPVVEPTEQPAGETPVVLTEVEPTPTPVGDGVLDIPVEEPTPTPEAPAEPTPTPETPAEPTPTPETPAEPTPTPEVPAEPTPTPEAPAEPTPTPETPAEPTPTPEVPAEPTPTPAVQENEVETVADEELEPQAEGPKVGDKIWIKSGSYVYKKTDTSSSKHQIIFNYDETEILSIISKDNGEIWYEVKPNGLWEKYYKEYIYVLAENTTTENPDVEPTPTPTPTPTPDISDSVVTEDGNTVSADGIAAGGSLKVVAPDETVLNEVKTDVEDYFADLRSYRTPNEIRELFAYDISVLDENQAEWQPDGSVKITLDIPNLKVGAFEKVYIGHMHKGEMQLIEATVDFENGAISFTTNGFSVFYGFIVDFEYNGLKYSLDGGGDVMLSELLEALEIDRDVNTVKNISFSDTTLLSIEKENGDYKLTSLKTFGTDEWLVIEFNDGTVIEIKVTDPVLFYYLDGTDWCMDTFVNTINGLSGTYVSNTVDIGGSALGGTHPEGTADVIIYARPGMAIRFDRFSTFRGIDALDSNGVSKDGLWRWVSAVDSKPHPDDVNADAKSHNFALLANVTEVKETTFKAKIGDHGDKGEDYVECEIKIVIVPKGSTPTLLKDALVADDTPAEIRNRYEIREIPVTLYDYDGKLWIEHYSKLSNNGYFQFRGTSKGVEAPLQDNNLTAVGHTNGGGPVLGILKDKLDSVSKLPVMAEGYPVDLFSQTPNGTMKKVQNVNFEFIYDKEAGYYIYSSDINHAQLSDDGTKVQLYREAMGTTADFALNGASPNYAAGGFYPYSDIRKAHRSKAAVMSWSSWEDRLSSGYVNGEAAPYGKDLVDSATKVEPYSTVDMHNGLHLSASFYLPKDKKTIDGEDFVYNFTGDDDLWVFIDDKLVLDIGGGHGPVSGSINFTTGDITVEGDYYTLGDSTKKVDYTNTVEFEGDKTHTLKIFYLERYGGVSNCRMVFNLPLAPENGVTVGKDVVDMGGNAVELLPDADYTFKLYTAPDDNEDGKPTGEFTVWADKEYQVYGGEDNGTTHRTNSDGTFTLKSGQRAIFGHIPRFYNVYAVEVNPEPASEYVFGKIETTTNGKNEIEYTELEKADDELITATAIIPLEGDTIFNFNNYVETQEIKVEKEFVGVQYEPNREYEFTLGFNNSTDTTTNYVPYVGDYIKFSGSEDTTGTQFTTENGKFTLKVGESIKVSDVPTGLKYSVVESEIESNFVYDTPLYNNGLVTDFVADPNSNLVTVTNSHGDAKLTITKNVDKVPYEQSFVFTVSGPSETTFDVVLNFAANETKKSITINGLTFGQYIIDENDDWSWRYTQTSVDPVDSTVLLTKTNNTDEVEFTNSRREDKWLGGFGYCKNTFTANGIERVTK